MSFKLSIQVKPQARKQSITKISEQEYQIAVQAAPVAGKANEAVVELLAKYFSVPKSSVKVLRGQSSRKKLVEIDKWERDADSYDSSGLLAASLRWVENRLIENI